MNNKDSKWRFQEYFLMGFLIFVMFFGIKSLFNEDVKSEKQEQSIPPETNLGRESSGSESVSSNDNNSISSNSKTCSWCDKTFSGTHYTHLGKMAPCQSSSSDTSIGTYCSMKCCIEARKSSCPTCG